MMLDRISQQTFNHVTKVLGFITSKEFKGQNTATISGTIKRNHKSILKKIGKQKEQISTIQIRKDRIGSFKSNVQNFQVQSIKYQWVGICFGDRITCEIQNQLREMMIQTKAKQLKFWGIIRGRVSDYYVLQGVKQSYKIIQDIGEQNQKNGQGTNYYTYWVTTSIDNTNWTQLPDITANQMRIARKIKKIFTGNLQTPIVSHPVFDGLQKHYLKCQICRITHALQLVPTGIYKQNDENPKIIQYEQQVKIPQFEELNALAGWVHKNQNILKLGRCTHYVDLKLSEQQRQTKLAELAQNDVQIERLLSITEDKIPQELGLGLGLQNPWVIKVLGDSQIFTKQDNNLVYAIILLRNIFWPGWMTIGYKNGFSNIYIGNGLKSTQKSLDIYENQDLQNDAEDIEQHGEPNPKELPPEVKPEEEGGEQEEQQPE